MKPKIFSHPELVKDFPTEVKNIFQIFNQNGDDKIRLVGGCARDLLLAKKVNDFDFATKFLPEETIKILEENKVKAVPTGVKYGTVTAVLNGKNFEITTLRKDLNNDGRHPKAEFVDDYFFDAKRRDFTINALYLDSAGLVYDYFDGISDLKNKKVRFIGDANCRIEEDFLRILRFFRFSALHAANYDAQGLEACIYQKANIKLLSADRVRNELFKIFIKSEKTALLKLLQILEETKIRHEIFAAPFQIANLQNLFELEKLLSINFSEQFQFFISIFRDDINLFEIFLRLNFSNHQKEYFKLLFESFVKHRQALNLQDLKQLLAFEKKDFVYDFYLLNAIMNFSLLNIAEVQKNLSFIENFILPQFPLDGEDVMKIGLEKETIGKALKDAKKLWAESDFSLDKKSLLNLIKLGNYPLTTSK